MMDEKDSEMQKCILLVAVHTECVFVLHCDAFSLFFYVKKSMLDGCVLDAVHRTHFGI